MARLSDRYIVFQSVIENKYGNDKTMQRIAKNMDKNAIVRWIVDVDVVRKLALIGHMGRDHVPGRDRVPCWQFLDVPAFFQRP